MRKDKGLIPALILTVICLIATALLAFTNQVTLPAREQQAIIAENKNRALLFPEAAEFVQINLDGLSEQARNVSQAFNALDSAGSSIGILVAAQSRGYSGDVPIMVALNPDGTIKGIRVLANDETPGLGKKVEGQSFLAQFTGKDSKTIYTTKLEEAGKFSIDSVSGATISSRAVTESLNAVNLIYPDLLKEVS